VQVNVEKLTTNSLECRDHCLPTVLVIFRYFNQMVLMFVNFSSFTETWYVRICGFDTCNDFSCLYAFRCASNSWFVEPTKTPIINCQLIKMNPQYISSYIGHVSSMSDIIQNFQVYYISNREQHSILRFISIFIQ
jgi:hypothetical protein